MTLPGRSNHSSLPDHRQTHDLSDSPGLGVEHRQALRRAATADDLHRPAQYRRTLVDPYRDHLRRRLAEEPGVAVTRLLGEIRQLGYPGSANLLVRYLKQGRAHADRTPRPHAASSPGS